MRLVHISDLHFGPHYVPEVGTHLLGALANLKPDTLVVTGDLTQRATKRQFLDAAAFLKQIGQFVPNIVVCPGNHDIALYRFWERLIFPFFLYRAYIHPKLDHVWDTPGAKIVALNSVRPYSRLVQGKLSSEQYALCRKAFADAAQESFRVLALHHPVGMSDREFHHPTLYAPWPRLCGENRLDIILTGHVHEAAIIPFQPKGCSNTVLLISCGTTTSRRGRDPDIYQNSFHLLDGSREDLVISSHGHVAGHGFQLYRERHFHRVDSKLLEEKVKAPT